MDRRCCRCELSRAERPDWRRYPNGKYKRLCPECDDRYANVREQNRGAKDRGYTCVANTPEYHRVQRERVAAREGRALPAYLPQAERERLGRMISAEQAADRLRVHWARECLRQFRASDRESFRKLYRADSDFREQQKAKSRDYYRRNRDEEVARVGAYKREHSDRNQDWSANRREREALLSDGSATPEAIARLKEIADHCAYCGDMLSEKQTDHMIPLALGGEHSLRNILIVCPACNGRKARLSFGEWLDRIDPRHRNRTLALNYERYGDAAAAA